MSTILCLALVWVSSQQAPAPKAISFDQEVARAEVALANLSKATGTKLVANGPISNEVVFLHVDKRPLPEVLDKFAEVTCGTWRTESDGTLTLHRSDLALKGELSEIMAARLKTLNELATQLQEGLKFQFTPSNLSRIARRRGELEEILDKIGDSDTQKDMERYMAAIDERETYNVMDPMLRAFARCLAGVDKHLIAGLPDNGLVTFSTYPNQSQRRLGTGQEALRLLISEHEVWATALRQLPKDDDETTHEGSDSRRFQIGRGGERPWGRAERFNSRPSSIEVKATREGDSSVDLELSVLDGEGKPVATMGVFLDIPPMPYSSKSFAIAGFMVSKPSRETTAFQELRLRDLGVAAKQERINFLRRFFDDPLNNEPLWLGNQEALNELTQQRRESIIACLSDRAHIGRESDFKSWNFVANPNYNGMKGEVSGHWIQFKPSKFQEHIANQASRPLIAACAAERKSEREDRSADLREAGRHRLSR